MPPIYAPPPPNQASRATEFPEEPKDSPGTEERWALANALTVTAEENMADEIQSLIADPRYEDVHERLKVALKNLGVVAVVPVPPEKSIEGP